MTIHNAPELVDLALTVDLRDRVDRILAEPPVNTHRLAVLALQVEHLSAIRSTYGPTAAEQVMTIVADRIDSRTRASDVVEPWGDDAFLIVLRYLATASDAELVSDNICHHLGEPIRAGSHELHVTARVGIAVACTGDTAEIVTRAALGALRGASAVGAIPAARRITESA